MGKVFVKERTVCISQDFMLKMVRVKMDISKRCPKQKNWLADAKYEDTHNLIVTAPDMTVDKWFNYWIDNIICDLAPNTIRNYRERYEKNYSTIDRNYVYS